MPDPIVINGKKFITSKQAAALTGYARDYVGQLVRMGKVKGQVIDKVLFVSQDSLLEHADVKNDNAKAVEDSFKNAIAEKSVDTAHHVSTALPESVDLFPDLNKTNFSKKASIVVKKEKLVSKFKKSSVPTFVAGIAPYADAIGKVTSYTLKHAIGVVAVLTVLSTSFASIRNPDSFLHNVNTFFSSTPVAEIKNEAGVVSSVNTTAKTLNQKINSFFGIGTRTPETTVVLLPSKVVTATSTIIREFATTTIVRYVQGGSSAPTVVNTVQDSSKIDALAQELENLKNFQNGQVDKIYESVGNNIASIPAVSPIDELEVTSTFTLNGDIVTDLVGSGLELTDGVLSATAGSGFSTTSNDYYISTKTSLPNLTTLQGLTNLTTVNATTTTFALGSDYITDLTGYGLTIVNGALTADFSTSSASYNFVANLAATTSLSNLNSLSGLASIGSTTGTTTFLSAVIFNENVGIGTSTPASKLTLAGGNFTHTAVGSPNFTGTYDTSGLAHDVYVSGKYAYVADYASGLQIIDISNPATPTVIGNYDTTGNSVRVYVSGKYAYVADGASGLQIIDISNPATPTLTGAYNTSGSAIDVYVSGKYAYVGDDTSGLQIIDISNPSAPILISTYDTASQAYGVYVSGKYAYVTDVNTGLQIIDISNPATPTLTGAYNTSGSALDVYVSGKYAYVADGGSGLQIIDISNPAAPTLVGTYDTSGTAWNLYVSGKYAYVGDQASGLQVIDISNPAAPTLVGTYDTSGGAYGVYVSGKYAYVADYSSGLQIFDINGIETPSLYAGNINTNDITITENADIGNSLSVRGGLNVGQGGIFTDGVITAAGTSSSYFGGTVIANIFTATSTTATSTFPNISITNLLLGSDYITDLTGSGLSIVNGALTVGTSGNWATTSDSFAFDTRLAATTTLNNLTKIGTQSSFAFGSAVGSSLTLTSFDCTLYTNGGKLTTDANGVVSCANDTSGSGGGGSGSDTNWSYFNDSGVSLATTTNQVVIGASATSSTQKLQVTGGMYLIGSLGIGTSSAYETLSVNGGAVFNNAVRSSIFTATSTTATSTFPLLSTDALSLNGTYITSLWATTSDSFAFDTRLAATTTLNNLNVLGGLASIGSTTGTTTFLSAAIFNRNIGIGTSTANSKLTLAGGNFTHTAAGNPTLIGTYDTAGTSMDVYISGKYAYVADLASGLQIIDISNPAAPTLVSTFAATGSIVEVYVVGKYAYIVNNASSLQIVDISNPIAPTLAGTYNTSGNAQGIYVSGKYAYIADSASGLQIVNISNPAAPTLLGTYNTSGTAQGVYVSGKYAYVADVSSGLQIVNISNPAAPTLVGTYDTSGLSYDLYVSGKFAYVADYSAGLQIINISNPASPTLTGTYNTPGNAYNVYVSGKYAYVADDTAGLQVIDISSSSAPSLVGTYDTPGTAYGVFVSGKYAYVADQASGLHIIDINGIETPALYAGNINTNDITITESADIGNSLSVGGALNVGLGGIFTEGSFASAATTSSSYFAGLLGIGSTSPFATFAINPVAGAASNQFVVGSSTGTNFIINNSGYVGIGTSSPSSPLTLTGATGPQFRIDSTGTDARIQFSAASVNSALINYNTSTGMSIGTQSLAAAKTLTLQTGGTDRITILSTGNVGIGTTSPYSPLSVNGTTTALLFQATSTTATSTLPLLAVSALSVNGVYANSLWSTTSDAFSFSALLSATSSVSKLATLAGLTDIGSSSATTNVLGNLKITGTAAINGASITANTGLIVQGAVDSGSSAYAVRGNAAGSNTTFGILGYDNTTACDNICNVAGLYAQTGTSGGRAIVGSASGSGVAGYFVSGAGNALEAFSTDGYGLSVGSTNSQGLHVSGSTYSIYSVGGPSYFENSIGIGTSSPYAKLSVVGQTVSEYFTATSTTATSTFPLITTNAIALNGGYFTSLWATSSSNYFLSATTTLNNLNTLAGLATIGSTTGTTTIAGAAIFNGNVGIGTTTPKSKLVVTDTASFYAPGNPKSHTDIVGGRNIRIFRDPSETGGDPALLIYNTSDGSATAYSAFFSWDDELLNGVEIGVSTGAPGVNKISLYNGVTIGTTSYAGIVPPEYGLLVQGDVGIGTTSPYAKLSVVGQTVSEYFTATSTTASSTFPLITTNAISINGGYFTSLWSTTTDSLAFDARLAASTSIPTLNSLTGLAAIGSTTGTTTIAGGAIFNGNVGIGTSTPSSKLTLAGGNFTHTASGNPALAGTYDTAGNAFGVYVSGKYAYVADSTSGLQIIDISNPAAPTLTGTYNTTGNTYDVYVSGKYAYVADYASGLQIIDISNPAAPTLTGTYDTTGNAFGVYVSGKYAYVADSLAGLQIINISNPAAPTLTGTYDTNGSVFSVYVSGKYAYVADSGDGLQIINISSSTAPTLTGTYNTTGSAYDVYVSGKYAYVADQTSGLQIINISNPAAPTLTGTYGSSASGIDLYVSGKYAYVADSTSGLQIIDINGIETPSLYAGNINTNALTVTENADIGNSLYVRSGLNVGMGGIFTDGALTVSGTSTSYFGGNLGVGTSTALARLDVFNNLGGTSPLLSIASSTNGAGTSTALYVAANGNVGIGTTTPTDALTVSGMLGVGPVNVPNITNGAVIRNTVDNGQFFAFSSYTPFHGAYLILNAADTTSSTKGGAFLTFGDFTATATPGAYFRIRSASNGVITTIATFTDSFNAGIGTTSPYAKLAVSSTATASTTFALRPISAQTANIFDIYNTAGALTSVITSADNWGIGTSSPYAKLSVVGQTVAEYFTATSTTATSTFPLLSVNALSLNGTYITSVWSTTTDSLAFDARLAASTSIPTLNSLTGLATIGSSTGTTTIAGAAIFNGNVGIGSTSPAGSITTRKALVVQDTTNDAVIKLVGSSADVELVATSVATLVTRSNSDLAFSANNTEVMRLSTSGSVGIGTTTPIGNLTVSSASTPVVTFASQALAAGTHNFIMRLNSGIGTGIFQIGSANDAGQLAIANLNLDRSGNVGIGTTTPQAALHVASAAYPGLQIGNGTTGYLKVGDAVISKTAGSNWILSAFQPDGDNSRNMGSASARYSNIYTLAIDSYSSDLSFKAGSATNMTIKNGGNVGIGSTSPFATLAINPVAGAASNQFVVGSSSATSLIVNNTGFVGIGTTSPWRTLSLNGTAAFSGLTTAAGTPNSLCINAVTKEITENAATSCVVSDRDQKQQIQALSVSGLDAIRKIQPVTFAYNDRPDRNRIGFIAQDLQAVDDRLGDAFDKNHIARSIDIPAIMSITVKAVKELDTKVTEQASTTENKFLAVIGVKPNSADNFLINGDLTFKNKFTIKSNGPSAPTEYLTIDSSNGSNLITFAGNGNIGIGTGTTTSAYKLQVQGDVAATAFVNISTLDAKTDVTYLTDDKKQDILTTLNSMKIAHYHYKTEDTKNPLRLGLIAEEAPSEVLSVGGKGVDIYKLSTFAIAAIQAQQKQIQTIDTRLTLLESKVALAASSSPASITKDELTAAVLSGLKDLFAVDKLTVGSKEKPSGITLFDEKTGLPYCIKIQNGNMATTLGECGAVVETPVTITLPPAQGIDDTTSTSTATTTVEVSLEPVASSTPIVETQATSTTP